MGYTYKEHVRNIVIGTIAGLLSGGFWIVYDQWKDTGQWAFWVPLFMVVFYAVLIIPLTWFFMKDRKNKKKSNLNKHFAKPVNYSKKEPWRTDFIIGQKGSDSHGHLALSGASTYYSRDESGREIVKDGKVIENGQKSI